MNYRYARLRRALLAGAGILFLVSVFPWYRFRLEAGASHTSFSLGIPSSPWYRAYTYKTLDGQPVPKNTSLIEYDPESPIVIEPPSTGAEIHSIGLFNWSILSFMASLALLIASAILRRRANRR